MKLYQNSNGVFYEKQADCPSKTFETVEFPFAASPKADFVAWLNQNAALAKAHISAPIGDLLGPTENVGSVDLLPVDRHVAKAAATAPPAPQPYFGAQHPLTMMAIEDWCEAAQPHQLGLAIHAAAQRLQIIAQEQENRMK
jgi:hypothetical protein